MAKNGTSVFHWRVVILYYILVNTYHHVSLCSEMNDFMVTAAFFLAGLTFSLRFKEFMD